MLTSSQIRAARAAVGWSAETLAEAAGLSPKTVRRIEASTDVLTGNIKTHIALKSALEAAGIEFIGTPDDRPGIRIGTPASGHQGD